jgi:hypothetical protein
MENENVNEYINVNENIYIHQVNFNKKITKV